MQHACARTTWFARMRRASACRAAASTADARPTLTVKCSGELPYSPRAPEIGGPHAMKPDWLGMSCGAWDGAAGQAIAIGQLSLTPTSSRPLQRVHCVSVSWQTGTIPVCRLKRLEGGNSPPPCRLRGGGAQSTVGPAHLQAGEEANDVMLCRLVVARLQVQGAPQGCQHGQVAACRGAARAAVRAC